MFTEAKEPNLRYKILNFLEDLLGTIHYLVADIEEPQTKSLDYDSLWLLWVRKRCSCGPRSEGQHAVGFLPREASAWLFCSYFNCMRLRL